MTVQKGSIASDLYSVESVWNYLGVHEYWGHGVKNWSQKSTHYKCYEAQIKHPTFKKLDDNQKTDIMKLFNLHKNSN